ncbi:MAG TPA: histidinol-phosphatase HisJ family protein [Desulfurivibrionaceae bacterium]|nr:histidinol-phosphatase HisJ family protein [Desulfurivibrionaceae bacterium]
MQIDLATDGHVHTKYCHHAHGEMVEYVEAAIAAGLKRLIFLEHLEVGINYFESTWLSEAEFAQYRAEGEALQEQYRDRIAIGLGVEVGYNPGHAEAIRQALARYAWDRVAISYHFFEIEGRHYNVVSRKAENLTALAAYGIERVITDYLTQLHAAVQEIPAQVVCHLDAVLRHHPEVHGLEGYLPQIRAIFAAMADNGMALEVNTSGFAHRDIPYPSRLLLREAMVFKLPLVAGSDAHRPREVGRHFHLLPEFLATVSRI